MNGKGRRILLFDVDGTICESGKNIDKDMAMVINRWCKELGYDIGIVGGGKYEKIKQQLNDEIIPTHIFSECGSVYYKYIDGEYINIYENDIRVLSYYNKMNEFIKETLLYLSGVDYELTGHFIDRRSGLIYISMIGMDAKEEERRYFLEYDEKYQYRYELLEILKKKNKELEMENEVEITFGGMVGIAIVPKKWNKKQIIKHIENEYEEIFYFGDFIVIYL